MFNISKLLINSFKSIDSKFVILFIFWINIGFSKTRLKIFLSKRPKIKLPLLIISSSCSKFVFSALNISPNNPNLFTVVLASFSHLI
jgi:hypothetical protein